MATPPSTRGGLDPGLATVTFATAAATLIVQVLVHRMISAKLISNYAFLVVSLTMLGFAASGVALTRWLPRVLEAPREHLSRFTALFVLATVASSAAFAHLPAGVQFTGDWATFVLTLLRWIPVALLFAVPFTFVGLTLGTLLAHPELPTRRVYFVDLVGSAAGALAVIPLIRVLGVEKGMLAACALLLAAGLLALRPRRPPTLALCGAAALVLAAAWAAPGWWFPIKLRQGSILKRDVAHGQSGIEYVEWDPVARIEIARVPPPDPERFQWGSLVGSNRALHLRFERMLTQNDYAFSYMVRYDGNPASLAGVEETMYAAAYHASSVPRPRVVAIGVGGGFDILTALFFDASSVTGVEVNGATLHILRDVMRDYFRPWVSDPRVRLVEDDGRHWLLASGQPADIIQLSGVDSYSGTPGAAHVFSESYLYTAEAFDLYLSRLSPGGVLNVMRLEFTPPREMLRALVTAVAALRRAGAAVPHRHVITVTSRNQNFTALLVKKTPFTAKEEAWVQAWGAGNRYLDVSASPSTHGRQDNFYQAFLALSSPEKERIFARLYPFAVWPATDDQPFFFNYSYWSHLLVRSPIVKANLPAMELTVIVLLVLVGAAAALCVYLPLRLVAQPPRGSVLWRVTLYFAGLGACFFAIEIALLQKFGVFLGHPNYALSVVLAALLFTAGVGSLAAAAIVRTAGRLRHVAYLLAAVILIEHLVLLPLLPRVMGLGFAARAALVVLLTAPIGLLLGVFLPWGIDRLKQQAPHLVPWAWGVNGIFSVLGPVLSVAVSITWGIGALLLTAVPIYLAAALALDSDPA